MVTLDLPKDREFENPWRKTEHEGESTYPADWESRRRRVYARDNNRCRNCGTAGDDAELHAHHIVPKSRGGTHSLSNLVTLCRACHEAAHDWGTARTD